MGSVAQAHDFGPEFEEVVASCLLTDESFIRRFRSIIRTESFKRDDTHLAVTMLLEYWDRYRALPSRESLIEYIRMRRVNRGEEAVVWLEEFQVYGDCEYVADRLIAWTRWTAIDDAIAALPAIEDPAGFAREVQRSARLGEHLFSDHTRFTENNHLVEELGDVIPTPWSWLNERLFGGPAYGDLCVLMSFINVGKTAVLVNIATQALAEGKYVIYFTFEDGEVKIRRRFLQRICGMTRVELLKNPDKAMDVKNSFLDLTHSRLDIKALKSRRSTVEDAIAFVQMLEDSEGTKVDMVITDYADRFCPPERRRSEPRHEYREVFEECKYLASELKVVHWTATQAQRGRAGQERVAMEHVAEGIGKLESCDIALGLGQTEEDAMIGNMNLYTAKMRDAQKGELHMLAADFEYQKVWDPSE